MSVEPGRLKSCVPTSDVINCVPYFDGMMAIVHYLKYDKYYTYPKYDCYCCVVTSLTVLFYFMVIDL